ncbi:8445_t:CDS:1, partial [Funneliformis caledonium]
EEISDSVNNVNNRNAIAERKYCPLTPHHPDHAPSEKNHMTQPNPRPATEHPSSRGIQQGKKRIASLQKKPHSKNNFYRQIIPLSTK